MSSSLEKLKELTNRLEDKLVQKVKLADDASAVSSKIKNKAKEVSRNQTNIETSNKNSIYDKAREENIFRVKVLYKKLKIFEKSPNFNDIFSYKAMNLSGIGLKEEDFGELRAGKYIQIIAITYEPGKDGKKKAKNISLGYFGKAETLEPDLKNDIIEFVLRWRYEKAFQNLKHYNLLISKIGTLEKKSL